MTNWKSRGGKAAESLTEEFDRFQDEFDALRNRFTRFAGETMKEFDVSPRRLAELRAAIDDRLSLLEDDLAVLGREARRRGGKAAGRAERMVHEQPLAALAVAAGIGFVAAHLFRRRRRRS